jgi:hypothetical protein
MEKFKKYDYRWKCHRSLDGMMMPSSSDSFPMENNIALQVENNDVNVNSKSHYQEHHDHPPSSRTTTATPIWHQGGAGVYGVMKPFIIQPSSIVITKEFKDRIVASSLASMTTFVTLSLLMLTGQGREFTCMCLFIPLHFIVLPITTPLLSLRLSSFALLSLLKDILPVTWIGNVIAVSTLKATLGGTLLVAHDIFLPLITVAMIGWGISSLILGSLLNLEIQYIMLPLVVMMGSSCIILCPFVKMKNLMLVVFYLVIASPLSLRYGGKFDESNGAVVAVKELSNYFVPGLVGTCSVGLIVAVAVHMIAMILLPRSTSAVCLSHQLMKQLTYETKQLFSGVSEYTQNIGTCTSVARQSRTLIEFYVKKRQKTLTELENCLPAMRAERYWTKSNDITKIECFVAYSMKQQRHAELIRLATTQQFLGEEFTSQNDAVRGVKTKMSTNLGFAVEQIAQEYLKSEHSLLFATNDGQVTFHNLEQCMETYKKAMRQAISDAETDLLNNDAASRSTTGPLIRQRVAFLGLFSFVVELHDAIKDMTSEAPTNKASKHKIQQWMASTLKNHWLEKDKGKRRHAMKTALGMTFASLWVSIPYLREHISYPSSIWVGVTVASVTLESTGASYIKCSDRLWGILVAGGFAVSSLSIYDDLPMLL